MIYMVEIQQKLLLIHEAAAVHWFKKNPNIFTYMCSNSVSFIYSTRLKLENRQNNISKFQPHTHEHTNSQRHRQHFFVSPLRSPPIFIFDPACLHSPCAAALSGWLRFGQLCQRKQRGCGVATQKGLLRWPKWKHAYLAKADGRCQLAVSQLPVDSLPNYLS